MQPVAVIILNWNGAGLLREYLPEVLANTNATIGRVIVADNGSTDNSREVLSHEFPEVETMLFDRNYGFAEGYNRAIELVDTAFVVLLNSDVAPAPGWLDALYHFMLAHPEVAGCQPKILSRTQPDHFEYAGAAGGFIDRNGYPYCRGRIFDTCEVDRGQYDTPVEVDWASGAALMVRTEIYKKAGGLDPKFFAHMEEIDLCWRIRLMGWQLWCVPQSVVYHLGGGSLPPTSPRKLFLNFRNNLLMLHKNLPDGVRRSALLKRRLLDTIAWAKEIVALRWSNAGAIFRAHRDFLRMRRDYHDLPGPFEPNLIERRPNILVDYYLRRRHTFE